MDYLNSVKVEGEHKGKTSSLWQKIMEFISRLFGIEIRDESLRAKEFNILADKFKENKVAPKTEVKKKLKLLLKVLLNLKKMKISLKKKFLKKFLLMIIFQILQKVMMQLMKMNLMIYLIWVVVLMINL